MQSWTLKGYFNWTTVILCNTKLLKYGCTLSHLLTHPWYIRWRWLGYEGSKEGWHWMCFFKSTFVQEVTKFSFDWNVSEKAYGTSTFNKESWAEWMSQAIQRRIKRFFREMKGKKNFFLNLWPSSFGWLIDFRFFVVLFWIYLVHLEIISTLRKPSMSHHSELIDSRVERLQSGL